MSAVDCDVTNVETQNETQDETQTPKRSIRDILKKFKIDDDIVISIVIDESNRLIIELNEEQMSREQLQEIFKGFNEFEYDL